MANHGNGAGRRGARWALWAIVLAGAALAAGPARAESQGFLCPSSGRLVSVGQHTDEVKKKCREPDDVQAHVELRTVRETRRHFVNGAAADVEVETTVEVAVEEWFYDFGPSRFTKTLRFEDGRLVNVVEGAKGSPGGG